MSFPTSGPSILLTKEIFPTCPSKPSEVIELRLKAALAVAAAVKA